MFVMPPPPANVPLSAAVAPLKENASVFVPPTRLPTLLNAVTLVALPALGDVIDQVFAVLLFVSVLLVAASAPPLIEAIVPVPLSVKASVFVPPTRLPTLLNAVTLVALPALGVVIDQVFAVLLFVSVLLVAASAPPLIDPIVPVPLSVKASVFVPPTRLPTLLNAVTLVALPALGVVIDQVFAVLLFVSVLLVAASAPPLIDPIVPVPLSVKASVFVPPTRLPTLLNAVTLVALPALGVVIDQVFAVLLFVSVLLVAASAPPSIEAIVPVPLSVNASVLVPPVRFA